MRPKLSLIGWWRIAAAAQAFAAEQAAIARFLRRFRYVNSSESVSTALVAVSWRRIVTQIDQALKMYPTQIAQLFGAQNRVGFDQLSPLRQTDFTFLLED